MLPLVVRLTAGPPLAALAASAAPPPASRSTGRHQLPAILLSLLKRRLFLLPPHFVVIGLRWRHYRRTWLLLKAGLRGAVVVAAFVDDAVEAD